MLFFNIYFLVNSPSFREEAKKFPPLKDGIYYFFI